MKLISKDIIEKMAIKEVDGLLEEEGFNMTEEQRSNFISMFIFGYMTAINKAFYFNREN